MGQSQCLGGILAGPSNAAGAQAGAAENIPRPISLRMLTNATKKFNVDLRIGVGGTGRVFRARLNDQLVAVKKLKPAANWNAGYEREGEMLTHLSHPNIINLSGFCSHEDAEHIERIVDYEYMPLRSLHDLLHGNIPREVSFCRLRNATNKFNDNERIGEGGTAHVFMGRLDDQLVAVKRLKPTAERDADYEREVEMLTRLSHPNIISLIGFCAHEDAERIVVYEYMPLRSLHDLLHDRQAGEGVLDWGTRMRIGAGVSKGLSYIHNEAEPRVIFGDLKPADVLLGRGYHPKISDFGAAINVPSESQNSIVNIGQTDRRMTHPYWAPEAVLHGILSPKSDVYSFGVLLLEIIIRTLPQPDNFRRFVAEPVSAAANLVGLADPELNGQFEEAELMKAMALASLCIQKNANARPGMRDVARGMNNLAGEVNAEWPVEFNVAAE